MTYLPRAIYLDLDDMAKFILAIPTTGWSWRPVGITWHNTGVPTLAQWNAYPQGVKDAWGDNLDHYYRVDEGWHAVPMPAVLQTWASCLVNFETTAFTPVVLTQTTGELRPSVTFVQAPTIL